jgi:hypothetical protein
MSSAGLPGQSGVGAPFPNLSGDAQPHRSIAPRGRPDQQCACPSESPQWREVPRPKTLEGEARSAQNALKHGMRAEKYVVLPEEDAAEFACLEPSSAEQRRPALRCGTDRRSEPNEPDWHAGRRFEDVGPEPPTSGRALHEAPASWAPKEPERQPAGPAHAQGDARGPNEPQPHAQLRPRETCSPQIRPVQADAGPSSFRANVRAGTGPRSATGAR